MTLECIINIGIKNSIPSHVMYNRIFIFQWSLERAVSIPAISKDRELINLRGKTYGQHIDIANEYNIRFYKYMRRLNQGWYLEDIILAGNTDNIAYDGKVFNSLSALCNKLGVSTSTASYKLFHGYSIHDALYVKPKENYQYNGTSCTLDKLVKISGIVRHELKAMLDRGMSFDSILNMQNNKHLDRYLYANKWYSLSELAHLTKVSVDIIKNRLDSGWSVEGAIGIYTYKGAKYTLTELAALSGLSTSTIKSRLIRYNMSVEQALEKPLKREG